ncbi:hypothetical protein MWU75_08595 [Ornithinimicrobium sp. F0845]|uniref:HAAS signaling domain-containing protein n=1 Tax=Ornithinimicrobium sp. F0845 TaxID=2926412 RepID=UPI001FF395C5|nr:hypothetical protein [Ornithinimicrobium sp. F0845]MCK0112193.1 hypothetical protein [Ornithinimicrobium sp. F0845]
MNTTQHPFVNQYLDDLARMLDHLPPGDRAELLAGVREHIEAGLAERPGATDSDVSQVLAELGPPEAVAREAYEEGWGSAQQANPYAGHSPQPAPARVPISDRAWVPVVVALLQVLALLGVLLSVAGAGVYMTTEVSGSDGETVRTVDYHLGSTLMATIASAVLVLPLWIGVALLVGNSRLWTARQKVVHLLLLPATCLVVGLASDLGWLLAGERGLNISSVAALLLAVVGGGWLVVRLTVAGRRRASDPVSPLA